MFFISQDIYQTENKLYKILYQHIFSFHEFGKFRFSKIAFWYGNNFKKSWENHNIAGISFTNQNIENSFNFQYLPQIFK